MGYGIFRTDSPGYGVDKLLMLEIILRDRDINKTKTQRNGGHACWILDWFPEYNK